MRYGMAGATLLLALLGVGCAQEEQMKRVENEVGDLKLQVFKLRQEVEEMNRRNEADRGTVAEVRKEDLRFRADLQETLRQIQDNNRVMASRLNETGRAKPVPNRQVAPEATPDGDDRSFQVLLLDYNRGNYSLAVESFEAFLKGNPNSPRRADAYFYIGLSQFNLKAFDKSLAAFDRIIKDHSGSERLVAAMLKKAQCQLRLKLKAAALKGFQEIVEKFPGTPEARAAQEEIADLQS